MKTPSSVISLVLVLCSCTSTTMAKTLVEGVHEFESMVVDDCKENQDPHGFYGAYFQPCEFAFFENTADEVNGNDNDNDDSCSSDTSTLVGTPTPVHWLFQLTEHMDKDDWDNLSSDDMPDFDDLMLWPDMCVAVTTRCYAIEQRPIIKQTLESLFSGRDDERDGIPIDATHVRVDCRTDALELSRVAYAVASGAEKSIPTIVAWLVTILLLFLVAMSFCCYGCFRLCLPFLFSKRYQNYRPIPVTAVTSDEELELCNTDKKYRTK